MADPEVVHVVAVDSNGRVVLQELSRSHATSPGRIGASAAGRMREDEDVLEAAERKLREELGVAPGDAQLAFVGRAVMQGGWGPDRPKVVHCATARITAAPRALDHGVARLRTMTPSGLAASVDQNPKMFTDTFLVVHRLVGPAIARIARG